MPDIATVVTADTAQPDEAKPNEQAYSVPADQPRRIMLDQIQGSGLIQRVGLTDSHALAAPTNIHFAGWYTDSVKPGDAGLSVIDGHVSGKYSDAIFKRLKDLRTGDTFGVEYGDASVRTFTVVAVSTVPEKDAAALLFTKHDDIAKYSPGKTKPVFLTAPGRPRYLFPPLPYLRICLSRKTSILAHPAIIQN